MSTNSAWDLVKNSDFKLLSIVGPTATGKSDLAIDIAKKLVENGGRVAIINADSFAQYRLMDIGTAKVALEDRVSLKNEYGIEHYMIDILNPEDNSTVFEYQQSAIKIIDELIQNGIVPILCGGSGLYVKSVIDGLEFQQINLDLRKQLEDEWDLDGGESLWKELESSDKETAQTIQKANKRRVIRAIEVLRSTKNKYISNLPQSAYRIEQTIQIAIKCELDELDLRIDLRTNKMRDMGLFKEVESIKDRLGITAQKAIGYSEIIQFLNGEVNKGNGKILTIDDAFNLISQHTKRLVRRQISWFKRDSRIKWI